MADQCDDDEVDDHRRDNAPPPSGTEAMPKLCFPESLLPGEDVAEFEELRRSLISEFGPDGADDLIDKCLKRLLFVRGVKSVSSASGSASSPRLLASTEAA